MTYLAHDLATASDGLSTDFRLGIRGMTCASCVGRVEKAIAKVTGVISLDCEVPFTDRPLAATAPAVATVSAE